MPLCPFCNAEHPEPVWSSAGGPFEDLPHFVPGEDVHFLGPFRAALREAEQVDILAAFIRSSGLRVLGMDLMDALEQGKRIRVLTGDYRQVTEPRALRQLFTWTTYHANLQAKLYCTVGRQSFHPKAYVFIRGRDGVAYVGSSNLSESALTTGVEWNVKVSGRDSSTFAAIRDRFELLFSAPQSRYLNRRLLDDYQSRFSATAASAVVEEVPRPHEIQAEVLAKLEQSRASGERKGLVVMATGLGKTYLSAFDFMQTKGRRALFVAHREEILDQAAQGWSWLLPDKAIGLLVGDRRKPDADLLFASVQTLCRQRHLRQFDPKHFDYVVIDEFHHAAAHSYRKLLAYFDPEFMLGLTATPDRTDGAPLLDLCGGHEVARVSVVEGITRGFLSPFRYFGVKDELDYTPIPWRSGRFDEAALTSAVSTRARAAQALREYRAHAHPVDRCTLVFCCSRIHADFMADYLSENGVPAASVHSGPTSASRAESLEKLRAGELEAICAVDVFNEGLDVPNINTILMLRPTQSPVIFLQQLGRGLRKSRSMPKDALVVIDFIGNHRAFMVKPRALLALAGRDQSAGAALQQLRKGGLVLPPGCSVDIETEVMDMLARVARLSTADQLRHAYATFVEHHGRRPSARELLSRGVHFKPVRDRYGSWFYFVEEQGDLRPDEHRVLEKHRAWFEYLQRTKMTRSHGMIVIEVLGLLDALHTGAPSDVIAARGCERLRRDPVLCAELDSATAPEQSAEERERREQTLMLRCFDDAKGRLRRWFDSDGSVITSRLDVAVGDRAAFDAMTAELVELRLAEYRSNLPRSAGSRDGGPMELKVIHNSGKPILWFERKQWPDLPTGSVEVLVDEEPVVFRFVKRAVNVASRKTGGPNVLAEILRGWFGDSAGLPGTRHRVELERLEDGSWSLRPKREGAEQAKVIPLRRLPYFEDLRVACGVAEVQFDGQEERSMIEITSTREIDAERCFLIRASGPSMDGGARPIQDGDLVVIERVVGTEPIEFEGQPVLLTGGRAGETVAYLKIPVRIGGQWVLRSANPTVPDMPLEPDVALGIVGRVLEVVRELADR